MFINGKIHILDGGFGSACDDHKIDAVKNPKVSDHPLWSAVLLRDHRDKVRQVHEGFLRAGADILTTNTYQCSSELFQRHFHLEDVEQDSKKLFLDAVDLARQAALAFDGVRMVAGSVGPYGACLGDGSEYSGHYIDTNMSREDLKAWHKQRIQCLYEAKVDVMAVETIPSVVEALAILDVVAEFPGLKCWISFQCKNEKQTAKGEVFDDVVRQVYKHPASHNHLVAIGVNCVEPDFVSSLLKLANTIHKENDSPDDINVLRPVPYVVYPNSGEEWDAKNKVWIGDDKSEGYLKHVAEWIKLGANIIGGCCRVGPDMISKIKDRVSEVLVESLEERKRSQINEEQNWQTIQSQLLIKSNKAKRVSKKMKKEEKSKTISDPTDLGTICPVPGAVHPNEAKMQLNAIYNHFEIEISDDECDTDDDSNGMK